MNEAALSAAPAGWRLLRACRDPERAQDALLRRILAEHAHCEFVKTHALTPSMGFDAYRRAVPIRRYDAFAESIDRMVHGEPDVLVRGRPCMFARTSGTTSKAKYLPVTKEGLRALQLLSGLWTEMALADHPRAGDGKILALTSATDELLPSGIAVGSTTHPRPTPSSVMHGRVVTIPPELHEPPDFEQRRFQQLAFALEHDLSMIVASGPTTLIVLFERLREWHGLTPRTAWPSLALIGSFIEGPSRMYEPRLAALSGGIAHRNIAYAASEGRFAVQLANEHPAGVLVLSEYVVELREEGANETVRPWEAELGKRYTPIVTTPNGLYRYDMEDTIEVVGFFERAPLVSFCHRARTVSLAGEHMTELAVVDAMRRATERLRVEIFEFIAEPKWSPPAPPYYAFAIEAEQAIDVGVFERVLEQALGEVNREYADKRRWARLGPVRVSFVPKGTPDERFKREHLGSSVSAWRNTSC